MNGAGAGTPWQPDGPQDFRTTHWSVVLTASQDHHPQAEEALATLCRAYWRPLYGYGRRLGYAQADAQDLTQAFFARLLERRLFKRAEQDRGRFRTFLLTAFKHFAVNEWKKAQAVQRGGRFSFVSWDDVDAEGGFQAEMELSPEKAFEKRWAQCLLDAVLRRLRAEAETSNRVPLFERLKEYLWGEAGQATYASIASELGLTPTAVKVAAHRLRQRFREVLRAEIAHTVTTESDIDDELRHLFDVVSG